MQRFLFLALLVTQSRSSYAEQKAMCDSRYCECAKDLGTSITARCRIDKLDNLKTYIKTPGLVTSLDISSNHINHLPQKIFTGFHNLVNLSLANNDVTVIGNQSFSGLTRLQHINLSNNKVTLWNGNLSAQTPNLKIIDLSGNNWLPSNNILAHKNLQTIRGVTWSNKCSYCTLVRNDNKAEKFKYGEFFEGQAGECRAMKHIVSKQLQTFTRYGFCSTCFEVNTPCYRTLVKLIPIHRCWDIDNHILNVEFLIGPIAIVLNLIVVINTMTTPKLRKNVAMVLVCNIAVSDLCLSLYSVLITSVRKMPYVQFYNKMDVICPCLGFLWLTAQTVTVLTLLLLTIERYLAIVYCMSPAIRIRLKVAVRCAVSTWIFAIAVAILPVSGIGVYTANTYCIPFYRKKDIPHMYGFSLGIVITAIVLYLVTIPHYAHIYLYVKRNNLEGFNRADNSIAKKIAVMVGCNFIFFCFPIIIALLFVSVHFTKGLDPIVKEIIVGVVPTIAFTLNCIINPLLYAYRNNSFVNALKERFELIRTKARALSLSTSPSTPQKTCTEDINMVHVVR